ncbi:MAG: methylenetetrahydrofolate reductase, partial [Planctomycetota bacterium]|nr:methylenetetrahydrofolate reductase [Planctomycetota bacterium]
EEDATPAAATCLTTNSTVCRARVWQSSIGRLFKECQMTSISIELVARDRGELSGLIQEIHERFPQIDTLNIPDLLRFPIRSWDAYQLGQPFFKNVIPHLRAMDFNLRGRFELSEVLVKNNVKSILVITGDKPQDMSRKVYRNSSLELIRVIRKELPEINVYAGIDPYRASLQKELDYVRDKLEAGAYGFFTQPFFDYRLLDIYAEQLEGVPVFWGICPVTSDKSKSYWESKNEAMFPKNFDLAYDNNVKLAQGILRRAKETKSNVYFMPIRIDPIRYLKDVFA